LPASRADKPRSAPQPIREERLINRLVKRLEHEYNHLYKLLGSRENYPKEAIEQFVYAALGLSPARYKGSNSAELMHMVRRVIKIVATNGDSKPGSVRSNPATGVRTPSRNTQPPRGHATNVSNGPAKPPRPLTERQVQQAANTPAPAPIIDLAATRTTRSGRPKRVSRAEEANPDVGTFKLAIRKRCEDDQELKGLIQASAISPAHESIQEIAEDLKKKGGLVYPKRANQSAKNALAELCDEFAQKAVSEPDNDKPAVVTQVPKVNSKPAAVFTAQPTRPAEPPIDPDMKAKIDRAAARLNGPRV